jgi:hypothetical protein
MDWGQIQGVNFLRSETFRIAVPVVSAAVGIWIKSETRHPEKQMIRKEDFAVGVPLIQTACVSFLTVATQKALQLHLMISNQAASVAFKPPDAAELSAFVTMSGLRLAFMLLILFGMTSVVRRYGWKTKDDIRVLQGITLPIAIGIICLYAVLKVAQ